jgi:hypothetical protein
MLDSDPYRTQRGGPFPPSPVALQSLRLLAPRTVNTVMSSLARTE